MTFRLPDGITADDYLRQVSEVMRNGVTATLGVHPFQRDRGQIQLYGERRDKDHNVADGKSTNVDITDQLRAE